MKNNDLPPRNLRRSKLVDHFVDIIKWFGMDVRMDGSQLSYTLRPPTICILALTPYSLTLSRTVPKLGVEKDGILCFDYAVSTCTSSSNSNSTCTSHVDAPRHADTNATNGKPAILYAPYTIGGTKRGAQARRGGGVYASGGGAEFATDIATVHPTKHHAPALVRKADAASPKPCARGTYTSCTSCCLLPAPTARVESIRRHDHGENDSREGDWEIGRLELIWWSSFQPNDAQHLSPARVVLFYVTYVWSGTDEDRRVRVRVRGKREERHGRTTRPSCARSTRASSSSIPPEGWEGWGRSAAAHGRRAATSSGRHARAGKEGGEHRPPARARPARRRPQERVGAGGEGRERCSSVLLLRCQHPTPPSYVPARASWSSSTARESGSG
ncbi:hypothetical protein B0H13DRAFT_2330417 [Mycena leptocephala]|nr:hypothetical protein B0H13DRAFT_2330417 [Mycena leptocephala]